MTPPSKELLSAVFGKKIGKIETKGVYLEYEHWENCINHQKQDISGYDITRINIYELAFRVREWALKQGYRIASQLIERGITIDIGMNGFAIMHTCNREVNKEREDTELEAVFAAGEWILNQQDKGI